MPGDRHALEDGGSVSAFVACVFVVFVACAALVVDGGRFVAARSNAADVAENAARAGAQELRELRAGSVAVDSARAVARAQAFLAIQGMSGSASADSTHVTVTVSTSVSPGMLGLFGVETRVVTVTRSATPFDR